MQVFTLYSSVFFRSDDEKVVFYNTDSYSAESFNTTPVVREICHYLNDINNLYTVPITEGRRDFCIKLHESGFGIVHNDTDLWISYPPSLALRNDWEKIRSLHEEDSAEVLKYLSEIVIFMGGREAVNSALYYQTEYPFPGKEIIDYSHLMDFLNKVSSISGHKIVLRFIFPFIEDYPNITRILLQIKHLRNKYSIFVRDCEYYGSSIAQMLLREMRANIVVINDSRKLFSREISDSVFNRFLIFDEKSANATQQLVEGKALRQYSFVAVYDSTNEQFIREISFPTEKELLNGSYTKKHLFAHQVLNTFYFGKIFITPDGNVYSNLLGKVIGTIKSSLHSIIINELNNNYSWRKTRYTKHGCNKCRLLDICPSISPLESYMRANCIVNRLF